MYVGLSSPVPYEDVLDKAVENQILFKLRLYNRFLRLLLSEFLERRCLY